MVPGNAGSVVAFDAGSSLMDETTTPVATSMPDAAGLAVPSSRS
jgi:hypothetical protein